LRPGVFGFCFRMPREKGAACRFPHRCKLFCSKPWPYGIATTSTRSRCTAYGPRPDDLEAKLDRVLAHPGRDVANRKFAKHLLHERLYLFTFLYCPGLDATNNVSERAIRALIGAQKLGWQSDPTRRSRSGGAHQHSANRRAKKPSMSWWNYCVAATSTIFSILCPPEKHPWNR